MRIKHALLAFPLGCLLLCGAHAPSLAQETGQKNDSYVLRALLIDDPPKIDGRLEESAWKMAPSASGFTQKQPNEGKPATENTEVKILLDNKNLYIGVMCFDSEPRKIIANEKKRDSQNIQENDHIAIVLDTFHDRRNGYVFATNPLGAMLDFQVRKEGQIEGPMPEPNPNINTDWNGVWIVKSAILADGWSTEMQIPLSTLRFKANPELGWRVNFMRQIRRKNEISTWVPIPRNLFFYKISLAGELKGVEDLKKGLNVQVKPYLMLQRTSQKNGKLTSENGIDGGVDIKYGVSSNMTLELTGNTDFSQVEADDQQINLTRFDLYFPEKREFFLENSALFNIGHPDNGMIFFSRRIGISEQGEEIPLLGGAKLAGKIGNFDLGFINLQARKKGETPANNFTVFRLTRDIHDKSTIGFMMTNRQSTISHDFNRLFCIDGSFSFGDSFSMNSYLAMTDSPELKGKNKAAKLGFRWTGDLWDFRGDYLNIQDHFNAEMGFFPRTGIQKILAYAGYTPEPNIPGVRRLNPHIRYEYYSSQGGDFLLGKLHLDFSLDLINGGKITLQWNKEKEHVDTPFNIHEDITVPVATYDSPWWELGILSDKSRRIWVEPQYRWGAFYGGHGRILELNAGLRPLSSFSTELTFINQDIDLPQGSFVNHLMRARLTYSYSPQLSLISLIQWNSDAGEVDINVRLNFIHRPGSDLFLVYNEGRRIEGEPRGVKDRSIALKFTYLFNF